VKIMEHCSGPHNCYAAFPLPAIVFDSGGGAEERERLIENVQSEY
jgi:hypothetical protein